MSFSENHALLGTKRGMRITAIFFRQTPGWRGENVCGDTDGMRSACFRSGFRDYVKGTEHPHRQAKATGQAVFRLTV